MTLIPHLLEMEVTGDDYKYEKSLEKCYKLVNFDYELEENYSGNLVNFCDFCKPLSQVLLKDIGFFAFSLGRLRVYSYLGPYGMIFYKNKMGLTSTNLLYSGFKRDGFS